MSTYLELVYKLNKTTLLLLRGLKASQIISKGVSPKQQYTAMFNTASPKGSYLKWECLLWVKNAVRQLADMTSQNLNIQLKRQKSSYNSNGKDHKNLKFKNKQTLKHQKHTVAMGKQMEVNTTIKK